MGEHSTPVRCFPSVLGQDLRLLQFLLGKTRLARRYGGSKAEIHASCCVLTFQVDDVEAKYLRLAAEGIQFVHAPEKRFWGYGAELEDPDGYRIRLWDEVSMREKG